MRENGRYAREVAKRLISAKRGDMQNGEVGRDVLSLLSTCFRGAGGSLIGGPPHFFEQLRGAGMSTVN